MCVPQRGHKKDFHFVPLTVRRGAKRKLAPGIHSLLAAHTHSIVSILECRLHGPPKPCRLLMGVSSPTVQSSVNLTESRPDVAKGQWYRGVEWVPDENLPFSCALSSDKCNSQLRHPGVHLGNSQPRLPALHIFKQLLPSAGILKELPRPPP